MNSSYEWKTRDGDIRTQEHTHLLTRFIYTQKYMKEHPQWTQSPIENHRKEKYMSNKPHHFMVRDTTT